MPLKPTYPGVYIEELPGGVRTITGIATSVTAFVGWTRTDGKHPMDEPVTIKCFGDYERQFGGLDEVEKNPAFGAMYFAVQDYFLNGGAEAIIVPVAGAAEARLSPGEQVAKTGLYALEKVDLFTLLCIPSLSEVTDEDYRALVAVAAVYCEHRRAMLLLDAPASWRSKSTAVEEMADPSTNLGTCSASAAIYFPRIMRADPLNKNIPRASAACGAVAGVFARTDSRRGVWKAPAGIDAGLAGAVGPAISLTDADSGKLNPLGCNCIRPIPPYGTVVWGARTLAGSDGDSSEWKYVSVRRFTNFLEESLFRGTLWVAFEPNDELLWSQIRLSIDLFMNRLFRQGAFQGSSPQEAYFVKCDHETTTQSDIKQGKVNILVGFAPLKPSEFMILKIQQVAGQAKA